YFPRYVRCASSSPSHGRPTVSMSKTTVLTNVMLFFRTDRMKRLLARAAVLLSAATIATCSRAPERPAQAKNSLHRHLVGDAATLDPITTTEENGILVEELLFRPLLGLDEGGRPGPELARSWT